MSHGIWDELLQTRVVWRRIHCFYFSEVYNAHNGEPVQKQHELQNICIKIRDVTYVLMVIRVL